MQKSDVALPNYFVLVAIDQVCTTQKAGRAKLSTFTCCGPQKSI